MTCFHRSQTLYKLRPKLPFNTLKIWRIKCHRTSDLGVTRKMVLFPFYVNCLLLEYPSEWETHSVLRQHILHLDTSHRNIFLPVSWYLFYLFIYFWDFHLLPLVLLLWPLYPNPPFWMSKESCYIFLSPFFLFFFFSLSLFLRVKLSILSTLLLSSIILSPLTFRLFNFSFTLSGNLKRVVQTQKWGLITSLLVALIL